MSTGKRKNDMGKNESKTAADIKPVERLPRAAKRKKTVQATSEHSTTENSTVVYTEIKELEANKGTNRVRRQTWTSTAIASFFEGLAEHGKAFKNILTFMQNKHKKKSSEPFVTNLNQVRFFYYRTWHKVSSLLSSAVKDHASPSQLKKTPLNKKPKTCTIQSDDEETEEEIVEGDGPFDYLDEGEEILDKPIDDEDTHNQADSATVSTASYNNPSSVEDYETIVGKEGSGSSGPGGANEGDKGEAAQLGEGYVARGDMKSERKKESGVMVNGTCHSLDLVAMICYSKLKQKYRGDKASFGKRLHDLVYNGSTTIRKGKRRIQIKIPNCAALRNGKTPLASVETPATNELSHSSDNITIEMRPFNPYTWACIQEQSFNPRLRLTVAVSRTLSEFFSFISNKWNINKINEDIFTALRLYNVDSEVPLIINPSMTIKDLQSLLNNQSTDNKIQLQYELCPNKEPSLGNTNYCQLLNIVEFLHYMKTQPPLVLPADPIAPVTSITPVTASIDLTGDQGMSSKGQTTPKKSTTSHQDMVITPIMTTPTRSAKHSISCPSLAASNALIKDYMQSLSKTKMRSPLRSTLTKSPLDKYKRLQQHSVSPLKLSYPAPTTRSPSRKPIKRTRLNFSSIPETVATTTATPVSNANTDNTISLLANCQLLASTLKTPQLNERDWTNSFALTKQKTSKQNSKQTKGEKSHLVTLSNKTMVSSGPFANLKLNDLFQSAQDNLKDNVKSTHSSTTDEQSKASASASNTSQKTSTKNTTFVPKGSTILTAIASPDHIQEAIKASSKKKNKQSKTSDNTATTTSFITTTPTNTSVSLQSSSQSPLQLLASRVALSSVTSSDVIVKPLTVSASASSVNQFKKPSNKKGTLSSNPKQQSQRLIPKPLQYLPQTLMDMTSSPLVNHHPPISLPSSLGNKIITQPSSTPVCLSSSSSLPPSLINSSNILSSISQRNVNPEALQQQLTSLLLNMLQQQVKINQQQQQQQQIQTILNSLQSTLVTSNQQQQTTTNSHGGPPSYTSPSEMSLLNAPLPSIEKSELFQSSIHEAQISSSDTVNELLKGLAGSDTSQHHQDSLQRLSEETVDVLPSFANMLKMNQSNFIPNDSSTSTSIGDKPGNCSTIPTTDGTVPTTDGTIATNDGTIATTDGMVEQSVVPGPIDEPDNSLFQLLQSDNSELGGVLSDSNLNHIVENTDFNDMFSQLRDILKTPEKSLDKRHESGPIIDTSSIEPSYEDLYNSPYKTSNDGQSNSAGRLTVRSILEENSVDYINKFKELASAMNQTSQAN
jgi:hypothetical protein